MAEEVHPHENGAPPAGEAVHLPGPSFLPVLVALGLTLAITGVVSSPILVGLGVGITLRSVVRWIRETRRDIAELPLEHH